MNKPNSLWNIKGVSPVAQDAAKKGARISRQPLGRWLSQVIHKTSADERGEPVTPSEWDTQTGAASAATWQEAVAQLEVRIAEIERQPTAPVLPVENALVRIADRLDALEIYVLRRPRQSYLRRLLRR